MYLKLGALLGDNIVYHDIPTSHKQLGTRLEVKEFPFEKEERDKKYLESRKNNKSLSVFD